jgi:probable HAF family extracellular repeat protein
VIDLGTLGGSEAVPMALNDNGQVVGYSTTADGQQHAFLWTNGVMRDLDLTFPSSAAHVITNAGLVGGVGYTTDGYPLAHVFVWNSGTVTDFGPVWGRDEHLTIVGINGPGDFAVRSNATESGTQRSAIWQGGVKLNVSGLRPLSDVAGANAMNSHGQTVGLSRMGDFGGDEVFHPFIWENGVTRELPLLGNFLCYNETDHCAHGEAVGINSSGAVIGRSHGADRLTHGVLWTKGAVRDLGFEWPVVINEAGEIAGQSGYYGGEGYFWRDGAVMMLGSLGGGGTRVNAMNDQSTIAGFSLTIDGKPHVFVWKPGHAGLTDLGIGPAGTVAEGALAIAINARGDIIGRTVGACFQRSDDGRCYWWDGPSRAILWRVKP